MPLHITLTIVVLGVSATVLLVHLMGWSAKRHIQGLTDARKIWDGCFPAETIAEIHESDDEEAAILTLESGAVGLIWALGDEAVVRLLKEPKKVEQTDAGLCVHLSEFTAPQLKIALQDQSARARWIEILTKIQRSPDG